MKFSLEYGEDRMDGYVWLSCEGKYYISGVRTTREFRKTKRLYYHACKKLNLNPRKHKQWWHK